MEELPEPLVRFVTKDCFEFYLVTPLACDIEDIYCLIIRVIGILQELSHFCSSCPVFHAFILGSFVSPGVDSKLITFRTKIATLSYQQTRLTG